jgi:hypothetical protein
MIKQNLKLYGHTLDDAEKELCPELSKLMDAVNENVDYDYIKAFQLISRVSAELWQEIGARYQSTPVLLQFSLALKRTGCCSSLQLARSITVFGRGNCC